MQCAGIPLNTAIRGEQPRFKLFPWVFKPLISNTTSNNPIVRNLNLIEFNIASTIDTIGQPGIKKTILLSSSKFSKLLNAPARINLNLAYMQPDQQQYNQSYQPVAVLLEGKFESAFKDRINMGADTLKMLGYKAEGEKTSMIVVSDGDIAINDVKRSENYAYPLGYDKYTQQQYGNKDFIVNCMNYLCGDSALLTVRTKQLQLRLLDTTKAQTYRTQWQLINMLVPIGLIILLGIVLAYVRKQKYAK
jgi:ABC-2 type transport system permease protein